MKGSEPATGEDLFEVQMASKAVLVLLRAYKWAISPMLAPSCRYVPTCSEFAMEAVERYGALARGLDGDGEDFALSSFCEGRVRSGACATALALGPQRLKPRLRRDSSGG